MTIAGRQDAIVETINSLGDGFEQYSYLIFRAGQLPPMTSEYKTDEALVAGCQSIVWLRLNVVDGIMNMQADSDTLIIKGILAILAEIVDGCDANEIISTPITVLERTDLAATFESERLTGIRSILKSIRDRANEG